MGVNVDAVALDKELRSRLNGLDQQMVFTHENGNALGYFLPAQDYQRLVLNSIEIPLDKNEIERRRQNKAGSSLQEIWTRLGAK